MPVSSARSRATERCVYIADVIARPAIASWKPCCWPRDSVAVFTTVAIVIVLVVESSGFFEHVSIKDFLTDTMWTPLFADAHYGILPLVAGTLTVRPASRCS